MPMILIHLIFFLCFQIQAIASTQYTPIKISLDWMLNPHHAPLVIGIEKGYFKAQGLDVQLLGSVGSLEGCKQVAAGNIDFAIVVEPQWIIQSALGLPLKPVCTLIPKSLEVFVSRIPLSELKGKRIGHCSSGVGFSAAVLKEILAQQNISLSEVELIYTRQALTATFVAGQIDAVTNIYKPYGIYDIKQHSTDFYVYSFEELGIPNFAAAILVSRSTLPADIEEKLSKALKESCKFLKNHPDEAWETFKKYKPELDTLVNAQGWKEIVATFGIEKVSTEGPHYKALKDFLEKYKLI